MAPKQQLQEKLTELGTTLQLAGIKAEPTPVPTEEPGRLAKTYKNRDTFLTVTTHASYDVALINTDPGRIQGPNLGVTGSFNFPLAHARAEGDMGSVRMNIGATLGYRDFSSPKQKFGDDLESRTVQYITPLSNMLIAKPHLGVTWKPSSLDHLSFTTAYNFPNKMAEFGLQYTRDVGDVVHKNHKLAGNIKAMLSPQGNAFEAGITYAPNGRLAFNVHAGITSAAKIEDYYYAGLINQFTDNLSKSVRKQHPTNGVDPLKSITYSAETDKINVPYAGFGAAYKFNSRKTKDKLDVPQL